ncbi:MAG: NAD(P)/FAD-dependent oxidoreductase, partial [Betaproteobacteria bacterium]
PKLRYAGAARVCGISGSSGAFELCVATSVAAQVVAARHVVLAAGALERPLPIAGGALAGVAYAGAALRQLKTSRRTPPGRVVLAGCGPLLYAAAVALRRAGADVVAMLDTLNVMHFVRALPDAIGFMRSSYYAAGAKLLQEVNDNIPIYHDVIELAGLGNEKLASVRFTSNRRTVTLIADTLLLHQGVVPDIYLADSLGCEIGWDDRLVGWAARVDVWGASSVAGVFIAGDGAAIEGAMAAEHRGRICALAAASALGHIDSAARDSEAQAHRRALAEAMRGRRFLERVYRAPQRFRLPQGQAIVCRCEGVTAEEVIAAARHAKPGPNQVKAFLRCGMGPCQGRECSLTVTEMIAHEHRSDPAQVGRFRARFPARAMSLTELASLADAADGDAACDAPIMPGEG